MRLEYLHVQYIFTMKLFDPRRNYKIFKYTYSRRYQVGDIKGQFKRAAKPRGVEGGTKVMQCRNMSRIKRGETGSALRRRLRRLRSRRSRRRFY